MYLAKHFSLGKMFAQTVLLKLSLGTYYVLLHNGAALNDYNDYFFNMFIFSITVPVLSESSCENPETLGPL